MFADLNEGIQMHTDLTWPRQYGSSALASCSYMLIEIGKLLPVADRACIYTLQTFLGLQKQKKNQFQIQKVLQSFKEMACELCFLSSHITTACGCKSELNAQCYLLQCPPRDIIFGMIKHWFKKRRRGRSRVWTKASPSDDPTTGKLPLSAQH